MLRFWPLLLLAVVGCSSGVEGYDPSLVYPPRTDRLVMMSPTTPPLDLHPSGKLDWSIAQFDSNGGRTIDPSAFDAAQVARIEAPLRELFATPAAPMVVEPDGGDRAARLGLTPERLAAGSRLYKDKCVQCHGMMGDGRGPTGQWVYPPPRDLRLGKFKLTSSPDGNSKPTREDLHTLLRKGIRGNAMPAFGLLPESDLELLTAYTIHLSLRGEVERSLVIAVNDDEEPPGPLDGLARKVLERALDGWLAAEATTLNRTPPPWVEPRDAGTDEVYDAEVTRGADLFTTNGCATCHRDYGRTTHYLYDAWGVAVRPSNLVLGEHKGGSEPIELFRRVRVGISPSGMPAAGSLGDLDTWRLVAFLKALPTPRHLPPAVRGLVYPDAK